jgi:hypothetical protein
MKGELHEHLAEELVDPLLKDRKIIDDTSHILNDTEARRISLLIVARRRIKEKGLTKLSLGANSFCAAVNRFRK